MVTGVDNNKLHRLPEERMPGPQTATNSFQAESVDGMGDLVPEESRQHCDGVTETKHSCMNIEPVISDNENS
jgi:hypothetical protein